MTTDDRLWLLSAVAALALVIAACFWASAQATSTHVYPGENLQAAIDALGFEGGEIVLGPGVHVLTAPLNFNENTNATTSANAIVIRGAGKYLTQLQANGTVIDWEAVAPLATGFFKCEVRDLTIRDTSANHTGPVLRLYGHDQLTVQNVSISSAGALSQLLFLDEVANSRFYGVEFNGGGVQIFSPSAAVAGVNKNVFASNQFVDGALCVDLRDGNENLWTGNQFIPAGAAGWHIRFREDGIRNVFSGNQLRGNMLIDYSPGHRIVGNVIEGELKLQGVQSETQFDRIVHVVANIIETYTP